MGPHCVTPPRGAIHSASVAQVTIRYDYARITAEGRLRWFYPFMPCILRSLMRVARSVWLAELDARGYARIIPGANADAVAARSPEQRRRDQREEEDLKRRMCVPPRWPAAAHASRTVDLPALALVARNQPSTCRRIASAQKKERLRTGGAGGRRPCEACFKSGCKPPCFKGQFSRVV